MKLNYVLRKIRSVHSLQYTLNASEASDEISNMNDKTILSRIRLEDLLDVIFVLFNRDKKD